MLEKQTLAPDFCLKDENGVSHKLSDFRGKKVILYFYPKDNTPGCTNQACGFRDNYPFIEEKNAIVIGISKDSTRSHKNFKAKYDLPFLLLSDEDHKVIELYDVWKEKNMYGKKYMGIVRSSYLIDENGMIIEALEKVKAKENPSEMLALL